MEVVALVVALVEVLLVVVVGCEKVEGIGLCRSTCQSLVVLFVSLEKVLEEDRLTLEAGSTAGHPLAPPLTFVVAVAKVAAVVAVVGARTVVAVASVGSTVVAASAFVAGGRGAAAVVAGGAEEKVEVDHEEQRVQEEQKRGGRKQKEKEERREKG